MRCARTIGALRVVLLTVIFGFLTLDLALRFVAPYSSVIRLALWSPQDHLSYDHLQDVTDLQAFFPVMPKPFADHAGFILDAHGFRTHPYITEKSGGTLRLLTIGDSFTFSSGGVPYEDMWNTRVAESWEKNAGRPVELINLGIPAAGPHLERRVFTIEGNRLSPDLVILGLFVGNDFSDESYIRPPLERRWIVTRFLHSLARIPALLQARAQARAAAAQPKSDAEPLYRYDEKIPLFSEKIFQNVELDRSLFFLPSWHDRTEKNIASVAMVLEQLAEEVHATGAEFLVIVIPDEVQVNDALKKDLLMYGTWREFPLTSLDTEGTQKKIVDAFRAKGIETLDLLPPLRTALKEGDSPYALRNTHWNVRGNAIAAQSIIEFLAKKWPELLRADQMMR
ncbi:MAG: hypothetical protein Greene041662_919 [Candidatus Peregrinibacteria bacterium Greene0416_62]|nr:MAG: hypothetical protein Greene041662_919 [Candidatus Peregrinibacteria bacterium Greene0416_62]TSD00495.1 MAG: hypothetical protein Greene101449_105 [Candidatus Peregrinibacteria bacterium Greene1014_49]